MRDNEDYKESLQSVKSSRVIFKGESNLDALSRLSKFCNSDMPIRDRDNFKGAIWIIKNGQKQPKGSLDALLYWLSFHVSVHYDTN